MTEADVKRELNKSRAVQKEYKLMKEKVDDFERMISYPGGISYETDGSVKATKTNTIALKLDKLLEYQDELEAKKKSMLYFRERAECMISLLNQIGEREVMTKYYIIGKTWEEVIEETNYSPSGVFKINKRAIRKIAKIVH